MSIEKITYILEKKVEGDFDPMFLYGPSYSYILPVLTGIKIYEDVYLNNLMTCEIFLT